jgi:DHA1 family bicyclomycin/chloramphenicol resistance-like MFS transporter
MQGYWQLGLDPRFLLLALASGVPFNGMFLYVLSAPVFLGEHLGLAPTQFFWFFVLSISGIMAGAWVSGRLAGKIAPKQQIKYGFAIMLLIALINLAANILFKAEASWALIPISIFSFGWAMMVPVVTLLVLDLHPMRRGMASSLQSFIGATANGLVAGMIAPLIMHSTVAMAAASLVMMCVGLVAWIYVRRRWPEIGQMVVHPLH